MGGKLTPFQRTYVRKRTKIHEPDPSELDDELNIVPFLDVVVNIIVFLLATTQAVLAVAQIEATSPAAGRGGGGGASSSLNLSVLIGRQGIFVSGSGGHLQTGCTMTGDAARPTIPLTSRPGCIREAGGQCVRPTNYNFDALHECAVRLHREHPEENRVTITAEPEIAYENVVQTMDALRADGSDELFPNVLFSAGYQ